jgi:hypothetical protein
MHHPGDRHTATSPRSARESDFRTGGLEHRLACGLVLVAVLGLGLLGLLVRLPRLTTVTAQF